MYEGDEINSFDGNGTFDRPGAIVSSNPDEQQNAVKTKAPKAPKEADVPAPVFFNEPAPVAEPVRAQRRVSKTPFIIGGAILAGILVIVLIVSLVSTITNSTKGGKDSAVAGKINTAAIFDKDAPVPFSSSGRGEYGYINPKTNKWAIKRQFTAASEFYGNYAKAEKGGKNVVINRKGEIIVEVAPEEKIKYDINENIWTIGSNIYNGQMKKANEDGTTASYAGYGYAVVVPIDNSKDSVSDTGIPYLVKVENGEKVYSCKSIGCVIILSTGQTDSTVYAIISEFGDPTKIINLENNSELYKTGAGNIIAVLSNGVFAEKDKSTDTIVKYVLVDGGTSSTTKSKPSTKFDNSISRSKKYYAEECGQFKGIKITNGGESITECGIDSYIELSKPAYAVYEEDKKSVVLFQKDDGVHLFDMTNKKDLKLYKDASDVIVYENSAFVKMSLSSDKAQICNILEVKTDCLEIKPDYKIEAHPAYIIVNNKTYSYSLKGISNDEK